VVWIFIYTSVRASLCAAAGGGRAALPLPLELDPPTPPTKVLRMPHPHASTATACAYSLQSRGRKAKVRGLLAENVLRQKVPKEGLEAGAPRAVQKASVCTTKPQKGWMQHHWAVVVAAAVYW